jgi:hypothetical protein
MSKLKVQMEKSGESGKTSSERELYFFDKHCQDTRGGKAQFWVKAA